jgi:hypothetical protein
VSWLAAHRTARYSIDLLSPAAMTLLPHAVVIDAVVIDAGGEATEQPRIAAWELQELPASR